MKCCARTAWSAFRQVDAIRWCGKGGVETSVRWGRLSVLGVLVVLGLAKVCWRCSTTSGRRNCSVLGMPKCWKVGAGTFGPDALRWYLSSLPPSVRLGCFARLFLCLHVGPFLNPVSDPNSPYPTEADGPGTWVSHRGTFGGSVSTESSACFCEVMRCKPSLCQASLKRGVNGTCAVAHLYLIQVIIHRANALSWDDPRSSNTVLDQVNSSKVHCYIGQTDEQNQRINNNN